jgi:hypothetical protein
VVEYSIDSNTYLIKSIIRIMKIAWYGKDGSSGCVASGNPCNAFLVITVKTGKDTPALRFRAVALGILIHLLKAM